MLGVRRWHGCAGVFFVHVPSSLHPTGHDADPTTQGIPGFSMIQDGDPIIVDDIRAPPNGVNLFHLFSYTPRQIEMHDMMKKINQSRSRLHFVIGPEGIGKSELAKAVS